MQFKWEKGLFAMYSNIQGIVDVRSAFETLISVIVEF